MALRNAFGELALDQSVQDIHDTLDAGINTGNITSKFREAFESFTPGTNWTLTKDSGDIVALDGNALASSYLVISKDPLTTGGVTTLESTTTFQIPMEAAVGLSLSQRVLGQELAAEVVSTEAALSPASDIEIANISQSTTVLTVNTATPHGLSVGSRIGIYGVSDSRFNYPSLVVASIPTANQFTCTAGPGGTIASVTAGPFNGGFVFRRSALGYARNGFSQIWENATATSSSYYQRANSGDVLPSGTLLGNHGVTIATTAGTQTSAANTYAWFPSSEYRYSIQADRLVYYDVAVDATGITTGRLVRTQVLPDPSKTYKLRFRFTNNKSLTVPTAKIVSAAKSGSTTATITTATPHGLTTGDQIVIYGIRNQTNFANLTTATAVASVVSDTSFTIAFGASATSTSYGGMVARVQGGNIPGAFTTVAVQSATNDGTTLTLVGSANWATLIGDYVNVYGVNDDSTGASLGVDGVYKVANVSTTTLTLIPIGDTVLPAAFASTNCGGTVIKRTDARLSFARIFDYLRQRVEVLAQPTIASSVPVAVTNTAAVSAAQSGTWTVAQGTSANLSSPWAVNIQSNGGIDLMYQSQQAFGPVRSQITVA